MLCLLLLVTRTGIEPMFPAWEASVLTAWPTGRQQVVLYHIFFKIAIPFLKKINIFYVFSVFYGKRTPKRACFAPCSVLFREKITYRMDLRSLPCFWKAKKCTKCPQVRPRCKQFLPKESPVLRISMLQSQTWKVRCFPSSVLRWWWVKDKSYQVSCLILPFRKLINHLRN